jgi:penicillin-binding protein 2
MFGALLTAVSVSHGQSPSAAQPMVLKAQVVEDDEEPGSGEEAVKVEEKTAPISAEWRTQREARTLTLSIPAPRGQIVDRNGEPLAQTRVANYVALVFPFMKDATDAQIMAFANDKIGKVNQALGKRWSLDAERLVTHYKNRRWVPLIFSVAEDGRNVELSNEEMDKVQPLLGSGLVIHPAYLRYYPKGDSACHIIGYVSRQRKLPVGPVMDGDPLFEELSGTSGIEKSYDRDLTGSPGMVEMLFSEDGEVLSEKTTRAPVPGRNVVLALDYKIQKYAENALKRGAQNGGAFVVVDVQTGDVLAMASNPGFDLNLFVPSISNPDFQALNMDKKKPLSSRAYYGVYPPASTFKLATVWGALESGQVTAKTSFNCTTSWLVGDRYFHNHNTKSGEGMMNAITAIKRSCNTWMYQAALKVGADPVTNAAVKLGFGVKTGIPIPGESAGLMPTNTMKLEQRGSKIIGGELANISIGQGEVLATPLQVAQAMAAIANGENLLQPRLVLQVQDVHDRVISATEVEVRRKLGMDPEHRDVLVKGMVAVVSGSGGTGHAASIKHAQIAGKTGTGQWKPAQNQNLAWFSGFLPANNPVYAFAALYEGRPNEKVSGGGTAAPMVRQVFNNVFENASPDDPLIALMKDTNNRMDVDEGERDAGDEGVTPPPRAQPVEEVKAAEVEKPERKSLFRRLFGR